VTFFKPVPIGAEMTRDTIVSSKPDPGSNLSAAIEDDGIAGYLHLYRTTDKRKRVLRVWLYNRIEAPPLSKAIEFGRSPYWPPAPKALIKGDVRCERPDKCKWTFLWDTKGRSVAVARDGHLVAFLDQRTRSEYRRNVRHEFLETR
jgi:hypothetical protein